jgi:iron complex outermembrane recepter protein
MNVRVMIYSTIGVTAAMTGMATNAVAQSTPAASNDSLEEVVVSAQRRSENQQSVPIAISTISGTALAESGVENVHMLQTDIPGLNIVEDSGNTKIFLRGVGTTAVATDNSVGVYVDGVYIAAQASSFLNLSNIDHVEVLKGPQGTLFGRNTTGGVVQVVTKTPSFDPSADFSIGYGNYNTVTTNFYGTTKVADKLAADISVYYNDQIDSPGMDITTGTKNIFANHALMIRNKWLYQPTDTTTITLALDYSRDRQATGIVWSFLPGTLGVDGKTGNVGFYNTASDLDNHWTDNNWGAMLRIDQDLGWARAVSITGERDSLNIQTLDEDATPLHLVDAAPLPNHDITFSEELQLLSPTGGKLQWITGLYYMDDHFASLPLVIGESGNVVDVFVKEPTTSKAAFAQASYEVITDTHLTAGLRYTKDTKSIGGTDTFNGTPTAPPFNQTADFSKLTYRVGLDHQFTPDVLGYASYNTGFKSGQYSLVNFTLPPVKPEVLDASEIGVKSEWLDHRLRVNASAFYYDYKDIQVETLVVGGTQLFNAAAAKIYGLDLDMSARVTSQFTLQGSMELLHGRYTSFPNDPSYVPIVSPVTGLPVGGESLIAINGKGLATVDSPDFTAYVSGTYSIPMTSGVLDASLNVSYNSGYYWNPDNQLRQPSYALLGGNFKWTPTGANWDVRLWGNNITSKHYYTIEDAFAFGDIYSPAMPATYGVAADYHFR